MILIHWQWFVMIQSWRITKVALSPWDETQEDGVDTVAVNVVTIIDKVVNTDTEL